MSNDLYKSTLPVALYERSLRKFDGNDSFNVLFRDSKHRETIITLIDKINSSDHSSEYESDLFEIEGREFVAIINFQPSTEFDFVIILETHVLTGTFSKTSHYKRLEQDFFDMLETMHDDFVIIDNKGIITKVLPNFEEIYGLSAEEAVGKSVYEMEERKVFNPSIAIRVLKSLKRETLLQLTGTGKYLMCTAIPVMDKTGVLQKIISYTYDVSKYEIMKEEYRNLQETVESYSVQLEQLKQTYKLNSKIVGNSQSTQNIISMVDRISKFDASVLLTGESGVGKTMFAQAIHEESMRRNYPFITINCGAIPENLLETELFGYEKGAFTGASHEGKIGLIELAHKGVIFLDEIGDLPLHMQVKLLKVIQDKKVLRVGGIKEKFVDFRLISASNQDLSKLIETGKFRDDLYYRINVISIQIPPLRERKEDIFYLINRFVEKYNSLYGVKRAFSNKAIDLLESYSWPGNIRELENVVERMIITSETYIITEDILPDYIVKKDNKNIYNTKNKKLKEIMQDVEKQILLDSYEKHQTTTKVAEVLGISQPSVSQKLKKYLTKDSFQIPTE
ncbi:MAG: sigma 54-interacting transcriptional regulator [Bacillota bacterium]|nr:sigma 54-interacting transcriptional regulator [Bacillota bacterium]